MITHRVLVLLLKVLHRSDFTNSACAAALKVLWQLSFNHASKIKETFLDVIRELKVNNLFINTCIPICLCTRKKLCYGNTKFDPCSDP